MDHPDIQRMERYGTLTPTRHEHTPRLSPMEQITRRWLLNECTCDLPNGDVWCNIHKESESA